MSRYFAYSAISLVCLTSLLISHIQIGCNASTREEQELLKYYKPLAMDESLSVGDQDPKTNIDSITPSQQSDWYGSPRSRPDGKIPSIGNYVNSLPNIEDWQGRNITNTLFIEPSKPSKTLTKLITGPESPSFLHPELVVPEKSDGKNSKVLATFKFYVPIYIPAIKKKLVKTSAKPVNYVEETVTEMVPVKKMVPRVMEVIKAERVPQKIITNYVETDGKVPSSVNGQIFPNERVLTSVVKNYD